MKIEKALANIQLLGTQVKKIEFENDFIVFYEQDDTKKYLDVSYNIKECSYDEKAKEYIGILALYIEMQVENEEKKMKLGMELHGCFQSNEVAETWEKEFRELSQINGTAAVSYTHLDVYKRQGMERTLSRQCWHWQRTMMN